MILEKNNMFVSKLVLILFTVATPFSVVYIGYQFVLKLMKEKYSLPKFKLSLSFFVIGTLIMGLLIHLASVSILNLFETDTLMYSIIYLVVTGIKNILFLVASIIVADTVLNDVKELQETLEPPKMSKETLKSEIRKLNNINDEMLHYILPKH